MAKTMGGGKQLKDPSTSSPKRYSLRSKGPIQSTRVEEVEGKKKGKSLMMMPKTKGGGELFNDGNEPVETLQNHSRPRCRFPRYSRSNFPGPRRKMDPFFNHPDHIPILDNKNAIKSSRQYADAALSYLRERGDDYELVMPDFYQGGVVGGGLRYHHNFTAKRAGDPHAPTETFFSQVFYRKVDGFLKDVIIECCVSLGESDRLPRRRDNRGCVFCTNVIHHPSESCPGLQMGSQNSLTYISF